MNRYTARQRIIKLGFVSDRLGNRPFASMLDEAARLGLDGVEITTGGWSTAPHIDLPAMVRDAGARRAFADRGLQIIALNANGNRLHRVSAAAQSACLHDTVRRAGKSGIKTARQGHAAESVRTSDDRPSGERQPGRHRGIILELHHTPLRARRRMVATICYRLKMACDDGWMSIEHEDVMLTSLEGLEKSVHLLKRVIPRQLRAAGDSRSWSGGRRKNSATRVAATNGVSPKEVISAPYR